MSVVVDISVVRSGFDGLQNLFDVSDVVANLQAIHSLLSACFQQHFESREPFRLVDISKLDRVFAHLHRRIEIVELDQLCEVLTLKNQILAHFNRVVHGFNLRSTGSSTKSRGINKAKLDAVRKIKI